MAKHAKHESATPATEWLKAHGVTFREFSYDYVEHGGTHKASESLGLDEHATIKTLIMENESAKPLVILMHGDCEVSTKNLARQIGCKSVTPCKPEQAQRNSGYMVGGTSPFGTRKKMPVYVQKRFLSYRKSLSTAAVAATSSASRRRSSLKNWAPFPWTLR